MTHEETIKRIQCYLCKKRRITAPHHGIITTSDGQEIKEYDFADLCMECSKTSFGWNLNNPYMKIGNQFLLPTKTI